MRIVLEVSNLWKFFGKNPVLRGVSFSIREGETKVILGPSGAGKSTLLRCINLLIKPDRGSIVLDGEEVTAPGVNVAKVRSKIGFVFQHFNLFNHLTALENVMLGLIKVKGMNKSDAFKVARESLLSVGIS
ncbi:MAG: ATP-binding cassette domain-containing protein, partial [Desulfurococcaceae archaeon]